MLAAFKRGERGQSTAEYALVLVAAAAFVGLLIAFLSSDAGFELMTQLMTSIFDQLQETIS